MSEIPLVVVVGGDALAVRVCEELCATQGHRVALLWMHDPELAAALDGFDCEYFPHAPNDYHALRLAGVEEAASIMTVSADDRLNLQVALKARDLHPRIRLVLRQFNRTLARKLESYLPDCSVLSLSAHAAASYTARALDPACFYALQFPESDGEQCGFSERPASVWGIAGLTPAAAQRHLRVRVVAVGGAAALPPDRPFAPDDPVLVFSRIDLLAASSATHHVERRERRRNRLRRLRVGLVKRIARLRAVDPIVARIGAAVLAVYVLAIVYFSTALHRNPLTAAYFVATTFTSTGYGDITPLGAGVLPMLAANALMFVGVAASGVFIAFATAALTRAQVNAMQGLRQIRTRDHVLVCGAGNVGTRVIEYLQALGQPIVVIDPEPAAWLVEASRSGGIELIAGDATSDATLDLCNVAFARAVVALTDSDTANLEAALGARARRPDVPVVMRVQDEAFARSIARHFDAIHTFSTTALAAPAFAMLSRFPGTRGRIAFGGETYNVGERLQGEVPQPPPADHCLPLAVCRRGAFVHIDAFEEMEPYDRLLFLVPLSQFQPGAGSRSTAPAGLPATKGRTG